MKRIAVLTSGGDSSGMNACLRCVVRTSISLGMEVFGIYRGYTGLINGELVQMNLSSVSNIIHRGGTILKTARSEEFRTFEGRAKAINVLEKYQITGLIILGGDGSFRGAHDLVQESKNLDISIIAVPCSIDNDVYGTDFTIGYDTAVNVALDAVNKIRDTAESHDRLFFIEVMGRNNGFIAAKVGLASGAEEIIMPEVGFNVEEIADRISQGRQRGKVSSIIIVTEGAKPGQRTMEIADKMKDLLKMDYRLCVLGHIQRGGSPTAHDRVLASRLGYAAALAISQGETNKMVGELNNEIILRPINEAWEKSKKPNLEFLKINRICAA